MSKGRQTVRLPGAILLCGLALATVVVACEVPPPTAIAPAVNEVLNARAGAPDGLASGTGRTGETSPGWRPYVTQDGRIRIRGANRTPSLSLDAATAARNPLALLDGKVIRGGLSSLLTMVDTLEFEIVGLYGTPSRVVIRTKQEVD